MEIALAQKEDLNAVNELRRTVQMLHAQSRPDIFRSDFGSQLENYLKEVFENKTADLIVAKIDQTVVGFMMGSLVHHGQSPYTNERTYYRVQELGVKPGFQRQGIGRAMLLFLQDSLKAQTSVNGVRKIELDVWDFNRDAMAFYEEMGFHFNRHYLELDL